MTDGQIEIQKSTIEVGPRGDMSSSKKNELRGFTHSAKEVTGILLPKGDILTLLVEGQENSNLKLKVGQYGFYSGMNTNEGAKEFKELKLKIGINQFSRDDTDGMVYLENQDELISNTVTIEGGRKIPHFILGESTTTGFLEQIADYPGEVPVFEIEGNYVFGTFQGSQLKVFDYNKEGEIAQKLATWDMFITLTNDCFGFSNEAGYLAHHNELQRLHITNPDTGGAYASANNERLIFPVSTGASKAILTLKATEDQWGLWHEIGHTYQNQLYKWSGQGEVSVNISPNYIQKKLGLEERDAKVKNQVLAYMKQGDEGKNYIEDLSGTAKYVMFAQLERVFGNYFQAFLNQEYRVQNPDKDKTDEEKIQRYILISSQVTNRNLSPYFAKWGLASTGETKAITQTYPKLEKDIWFDIAGFDDRYPISSLGDYVVPTAIIKSPIAPYILGETFDGQVHLETSPDNKIEAIQFHDTKSPTLRYRLVNSVGVANEITIPLEFSYGNAISLNAYEKQERLVTTLQKEKKTIETYTDSSRTTSLNSGSGVFLTYRLYDKDINELVKREIEAEQKPLEVLPDLQGIPYKEGDIFRVTTSENGKIASYINSEENLSREASTKDEWFEIMNDEFHRISLEVRSPKADVISLERPVLAKLESHELVQNVTGFANSEVKVTFKTKPDLSLVGETTAEILLTDSFGNTAELTSGTITVTGGNSAFFAGQYPTKAYISLAVNNETKQFNAFGKGSNLHNSNDPDWKYVDLTLLAPDLSIKKNTILWPKESQALLTKEWHEQDYEVGDYLKIYHAESKTNSKFRLYVGGQQSVLGLGQPKWLKLTTEGWEQLEEEPLPIENQF